MAEKKTYTYVNIGVEPQVLEILTEPFVVMTYRGYAPVVEVKIYEEDETKLMFISSQSLSRALEEIREENDGKFTGIKIRIKKESTDKFAKYIIEKVADGFEKRDYAEEG